MASAFNWTSKKITFIFTISNYSLIGKRHFHTLPKDKIIYSYYFVYYNGINITNNKILLINSR